ncbi:MAG TPA: DUF1570 domain-containing protein [Gemmataceae bacterium]|nr:DUF1570 domain-containing protein [Gemmataceae bacterium]
MIQLRMPKEFRLHACWLVVPALALVGAWVLLAQPPGQFADWKADTVYFKSGKTMSGLVGSGLVGKEEGTGFNFAYIKRSPGKPTAVIHTKITYAEVDRIDRVGDEERAQLKTRLESLASEKANEKNGWKEIALKPAPWGTNNSPGFTYTSNHFVLFSNANEEIVRCVAARLEQVYDAYAHFLPPRRLKAPATKILLVQSLNEYQQMLKAQGRDILNPAFYDPSTNQILWACELQRLTEEWERKHKEILRDLDRLREIEAQQFRTFKGNVPPEFRRKVEDDRKKIEKTDIENERILEKGKQRFFQILYHEAFHAYLANFVYPPSQAEVPRWLNEGLAQIFETAIIEAGELQIGYPDCDRLTRAKEAERKGELVKLEDLLRSGPKDFLVGHASDQQLSDRYYLTSWALAFYLTFDRKKIDTPQFNQYVRALKEGANPLSAFHRLVGQSLEDFEKGFQEYVQSLRADGRTSPHLKDSHP